MPLLYDANGDEIFEGGVTRNDIVAAIQAAALAGEFNTAQEIADRHGWKGICLCCAIKNATEAHYDRDAIIRGVCVTCFHDLNPSPNFADVRSYMYGLIKRDVQ